MDLSWNSSGLMVACCLGRMSHDIYCLDKSFIYFWNISSRNFDPS